MGVRDQKRTTTFASAFCREASGLLPRRTPRPQLCGTPPDRLEEYLDLLQRPALNPCPTPQTFIKPSPPPCQLSADKRILCLLLPPTNPSCPRGTGPPLEGASRRHLRILHALGRPGCRGGPRKRLQFCPPIPRLWCGASRRGLDAPII